jgi:hypothetical protein
MFGTATKDAYGYFPDPSLKYDSVTMIIFGGQIFFDKTDYGIDWTSVQLLSYKDDWWCQFTDGKILYSVRGGEISTYNEKYDKNTYKPSIEKKREKHTGNGVKEITAYFCVKDNKFYYGGYFQDDFAKGYMLEPILEEFDVPNLRTILSPSGYETYYITDGKQILFGDGSGTSYVKKDGIEYVTVKECLLEGVDIASLRVLGEDIMADKNALYYGTEVIPFNKLKGFKFILREMELP